MKLPSFTFSYLLLITLGLLAPFAASHADTIVVNSTADPAGFNAAITIPTLGATVTLRDAVNAVNNSGGSHTITFAPALAGQTIQLSQIGNTNGGGSALKVQGFLSQERTVTFQGLTGGAGVTIARSPAAPQMRLFNCDGAGTLTVVFNDLTLSSGDVNGYGGAVWIRSAHVSFNNCTLSGNRANAGGAIHKEGGDSFLSLNNSTVANNHAVTQGGGIHNSFGNLELTHATITGNTCDQRAGGIFLFLGFYPTMRNCIVAGNTAGQFPDIDGVVSIASSSHNLISDPGTTPSTNNNNGAGGLSDGVNGNILGVDALLGALADNGGPTATVALDPASPAIDGAVLIGGFSTDQRGIARPRGALPDIGAFEAPTTAPVITTTTTSTTFTTMLPGSFQFAASGSPQPVFSHNGALPAGVTLNTDGLLSGTPELFNEGIYPITVTADNGTAPAASKAFALVVQQGAPLVISSPATTTFTTIRSNSFQFIASGTPSPTFSFTGSLPTGVTLDSSGLLSGTPPLFSEGVYPITVTAQNSAAPSAVQSFTLVVQKGDLLVTTAVDEDNGSTDPAFGTGTSLREAVAFANAHSGPQTITFDPSLAGQTIELSLVGDSSFGSSSALRIDNDITILGLTSAPGITITRADSAPAMRLFLIWNKPAKLTLEDLSLTNGSSDYGGAVYNNGSFVARRCAFTGNYASWRGGAIYVQASSEIPDATLVNCTIAQNSSNLGAGGVFAEPSLHPIGSSLNLVNCTIVGNQATAQQDLIPAGLGGEGTITNCIVDANRGYVYLDFNGGVYFPDNSNLSSGYTGTHNLIGPGSYNGGGNGSFVNGVDNNIVGMNVGLAPLTTLGSPTPVMPLRRTSLGHNAGTASALATTDQRGIARPQGGATDIGAYEYLPYFVVTTAADESDNSSDPAVGTGTSLREALADANHYGTAQTITFAPALSGETITVGSELAISTQVTIQGPGASQLTISGGNASRVFEVGTTGVATLSGLTIANGRVDNASFPEGSGGGILNRGSLTLLDCVLSSNEAGGTHLGHGGAIYHHGTGLVALRCSFTANQTGGGGYGGALGADSGIVEITASTFSGNNSLAGLGNGGAFSNFGAATQITNSTFSGNSAANGGAIIHYGNSLTLQHCTIALNTASFTGGGIERVGRTGNVFSLQNTLIVLNTAPTGPDACSYTDENDGVFTSLGHNLIGNAVGALGFGAAGDLLGSTATPLNPQLGPLGDNGGATHTHALLSGSPAINTGVAVGGITSDQRGSARSVAGTPDIGAVENETGATDPDGDNLDNVTEALAQTSPVLIDTDGDGYNDATEILSGSDPTLSSSVPGTTRIERVLGYGPARGLDLSGTFVHAFNVGTPGAAGQAGDATFSADNASGITLSAPNQIASWATRDFGSSNEDTTLETVFQSIRWAETSHLNPDLGFISVTLGNLSPGARYKLQLLFAESGDYNRRFDVRVDGVLVADDFNVSEAQGIPVKNYAAAAVVHEFTATGNSAQIVLSGQDVATPAVDYNPILNGVTLEVTSAATPLGSWRTLHGLAADGSQDDANPSGDGVANLLKYAFNMAPNAGDLLQQNIAYMPTGGTSGLPSITTNAAPQLVIRFVRRKASTNSGITYTVQVCSDLSDPNDWSTLDLSGATVESIDATWERVTVTDPAGGDSRFGRLRVVRLDP